MTSPEALEVLTWPEPSKARCMRRHVGDLLTLVSDHLSSVDIAQVLEDYPGDDGPYEDWVLGLGRPRHAAAVRRFREVELFLTTNHVATWDAKQDGVARQTSAPSASAHPRARPERCQDAASRSRIRATARCKGGRSLSRTAWTTSGLVAK